MSNLIDALRAHEGYVPAELAKRAAAVLEEINMVACYASEENTDARAESLLLIGQLARGERLPRTSSGEHS